MEAYKFETIVQENGSINMPELKELKNHKVEVIIIDMAEKKSEKKLKSFEEFSKKWKGCLKGIDVSHFREDRITDLEEKHK